MTALSAENDILFSPDNKKMRLLALKKTVLSRDNKINLNHVNHDCSWAHKYLLHIFVQSQDSFQQLFKWKKGKNQNKETFHHHHYIATAQYKG